MLIRRRPVGIVPHPSGSAARKFYRSPGTIGNWRRRCCRLPNFVCLMRQLKAAVEGGLESCVKRLWRRLSGHTSPRCRAHRGCARRLRLLRAAGALRLAPDGVRRRPHLPLRGERPVQGVGAAPGRAGQLRLFRARPAPAAHPAPPAGLLVQARRRPPRLLGARISTSASPPTAPRPARSCRGTCPAPPMSAMPSRSSTAWGVGAINPQPLMRRLDLCGPPSPPTSWSACARRAAWARSATAPPREAFAAGASEFEIELAFMRACGQREQELPYNPIIALNSGGAVLHYQVLEKRRPRARHSLLIDAGRGVRRLRLRHHAHPFAPRRRLRGPDRAHGPHAAGAVRAGARRRRLARRAPAGPRADRRGAARRGHHPLQPDEAVATRLTSVFLPHGIGHLLGLEVHDVGGFMRAAEGGDIPRPEGHPFLRLTRVLEPGFVVTMEPGIYFIDQLLEARAGRGPRPRHQLVAGRGIAQVRRHPHRGRPRSDREGCENLTREAFAAL